MIWQGKLTQRRNVSRVSLYSQKYADITLDLYISLLNMIIMARKKTSLSIKAVKPAIT
jgi:hypothetical protein